MCGIVGILQRQPLGTDCEGSLRQMLGMVRHRGPDQFGIYLDPHVALGNARLSILDLKHGQQPISNEDQTLWIVFNGEVFNYVELRADLEARGHQFTTHTDTEVVLHAYEQFGPDCLRLFNGQYALAIWDQRRQTLFLARDRLGVRPLFYCQAGEAFIFGSEIKALLADGRVKAELDPVGLHQIFTFWSTLSPRTAFRDIREVPPGHYLLVRDGQLDLRRYWEPAFPGPGQTPAPVSLAECTEQFRSLLVDAVRIRLRADVPVGAYLSGGLDSSTIAAIIRDVGTSRLDTFSISFSDSQFDESPFQLRMAQYLGTDHQVVYATHHEIGRVFPEVIWHTETPVMRTAPAPMFLLSKLVQSHGYKVVLTGEGADEFLAGYDIFKEAAIRRFWSRQPDSARRPLLLQRIYPDIARLNATSPAYLKAFFGAGLESAADPYFSHAIRWQNNRRTRRFFSPDFQNAVNKEQVGLNDRPPLPKGFDDWHSLARAQYLEIGVFLSEYLLSSQGDRPAMAHSVEGRFPFLDVRVVEFCNQLPARFKLQGLTDKLLLRRAARSWLPDDICQRGKRPYRAPIHRSFFNDTPLEYIDEILGPAGLQKSGIFNPKTVEQLVARIRQGKNLSETDDMALAGIISSQLWHHLFVERFKLAPPISDKDDVKLAKNHSSASIPLPTNEPC
jgi:asparagine synthase (glutamine-hydrolysing)